MCKAANKMLDFILRVIVQFKDVKAAFSAYVRSRLEYCATD